MRRVRFLVLVLVAVLALAGCQTEAFLEVQVDDDGGGAVYVALSMDQDAAAKSVLFESKAPNVLPVQDLIDAGWTVSGPTQEQDGRIWMRASKPFSQLDQITDVVHEVAGPEGPFRNFKVERSTGFAERRWQFSGTVDLSKGIASFSDDQVAAAFGGDPLGQPAEIIAAQVGTSLEAAVKLNVVVDLPGDLGANNGSVGSAGLAAGTTTSTSASSSSSSAGTTAAGEQSPASGADGAAGAVAGGGRQAATGAAVVWNPDFAAAGVTELSAASSSSSLMPRVWRWAAWAALVLGGAVLLYRLGQALLDLRVDRRRARARSSGRADARPEPLPVPFGAFGDAGSNLDMAPVYPQGVAAVSLVGRGPGTGPGTGTDVGAVGTAAAGGGTSRAMAFILIETTGALVAGRDPVGEVVVPFARERGCVQSVRQIADLYLARVVGGISSGDFWSGLGLTGDAALLDDNVARRFEMTAHVVEFLSLARQRGVSIVALGDDVPEWTAVLRSRFGLDGLIGTWVSSTEVGVRVPHPALLEAVERATALMPGQAMMIATTRSLLDAAARLGYRTVQYNPGQDDPDSDHPVLRSFAERSGSVSATPAVAPVD